MTDLENNPQLRQTAVRRSLTHGSLFSGIGGFDLASEWMGWQNSFHCEWNEFGKKILKYYWSKAISYDDITKTDFTIHRGSIDILTGGFPCQPYSVAGKRKGKDDERHLWPEMLRAIREIQPTWVVGENVRGLTNWNGGLVFDEVQSDLENEGYEVTPFILPAVGVNAPHRRERIWFIAHSNSNDAGRQRHGQTGQTENINEAQQKKRERVWGEFERVGFERLVTNTDSGRQSCQKHRQTESRQFTEASVSNNWQNFPTQSPLFNGDDGISARLDAITFPKWRNESIKGGGNAIVPQVAYQIFNAIALYDSSISVV